MSEPLTFVITLVLRCVALIFLLRFVLQVVRASFHNPFTEAVVRITDPVLRNLRMVLRSYRNLDFASFVMAWLAHLLAAFAYVLARDLPPHFLFLLNDALHATLNLAVNIFLVAIVVSIVMSWLAPGIYSPAANIAREVAEPLLAPARRVLPSIGGLDLSPMITLLVLFLIQSFILPGLLPLRLWPG